MGICRLDFLWWAWIIAATVMAVDSPSHCEDKNEWKCKAWGQCIDKSLVCNGEDFDCYDNSDEENCTRGHCESIDFHKCEQEELCVETKFLCDGILGTNHGSDSCTGNTEDQDAFCVGFCNERSKLACPYIAKGNHTYSECQAICKTTDVALVESSAIANLGLRFRCGESAFYIHKAKRCDNFADCPEGQDESEDSCRPFYFHPIVLVIWDVFGVLAIVIIATSIKKMEIVPSSKSCNKCQEPFKIRIGQKDWDDIEAFMAVHMANYFPEWKINTAMAVPTQQLKIQTYEKIHNNKTLFQYIHSYVFKRMQDTFRCFGHHNWKKQMKQRHKMYFRLFNYELLMHAYDKTHAIKCIQAKLGTCAEADALLDFKDKPSRKTKLAACFKTCARRVLFYLRYMVPYIKVTALTFDILKDYALLMIMIRRISGEGEDSKSPQDTILVSGYGMSIMTAHIFMGFYSFVKRSSMLHVCQHKQSRPIRTSITALCIIFLPFLGAVTAAIQSFEEGYVSDTSENVEKKFQFYSKSRTWVGASPRKQYLEHVLTEQVLLKRNNMAGFPTFKIVECSLESSIQFLVLLFALLRDPFDGAINRGLLFTGSFLNTMLLLGTSLLTLLFFVFALVEYACYHQQDSLSISGLIIMYLVYGLQTVGWFFAICCMQVIWQDYGAIFPLALNISISAAKCVALILCAWLLNKRTKRSILEWIIFIVANIVAPIPFEPLENVCHDKNQPFVSRFKEPLILWLISLVENLSRVAVASLYTSNEALHTSHVPLKPLYIWAIIVGAYVIIYLLLNVFLHNVYLFNEILYEADEKPNEVRAWKNNVMTSRKKIFKIEKEDKKDIYFAASCGRAFLFTVLLLLFNPTTYNNDRVYSDCQDVLTKQNGDGLYTMFQEHVSQKLVYCNNGLHLMQKTAPNLGNRIDYFRRPMDSYKIGFGHTSQEYWAGLDTITRINELGNNVLVLTGQMHNNTMFSVAFTNFHIVEKIKDNDAYFRRTVYSHQRNTQENFVIRSITNNAFTFLAPRYLKPYGDMDESKNDYDNEYHFTPFTAYDSNDNQCSGQFNNTGWWFPLKLHRTGYKTICDGRFTRLILSTNLNGMHSSHEDGNYRMIAFCNENEDQCYTGTASLGDGGNYIFAGETIKLTSTELRLLRGSAEGNKTQNPLTFVHYE